MAHTKNADRPHPGPLCQSSTRHLSDDRLSDPESSCRGLYALHDNGTGMTGTGVPFTDPATDGPEIRKAALHAPAGRTKLTDTLALARKFRRHDQKTPLALMGHANPVQATGCAAFFASIVQAGIDGAIFVNLPPEEDHVLRTEHDQHGLACIRLETPTSGRSACAGFGIRTAAQAAAMGVIADGVVAGCVFVEQAGLAYETGKPHTAATRAGACAHRLRSALRQSRKSRARAPAGNLATQPACMNPPSGK